MDGAIKQMLFGLATPMYLNGRLSRSDAKQVSLTGTSFAISAWKGEGSSRKETRFRTIWRAQLNADLATNTLVKSGLTNPLALAWEVIPYSFVCDWWINVGDVLASLDNLTLIDNIWVLDSTSVKTVEEWTTNGYQNGAGTDFALSGSMMKVTRTDTREAVKTISRINSLQYKPSTSWEHIANGIALLQKAKKSNRR